MKKIAIWLLAIPVLSCLILISSCKKDSDSPSVVNVEGISFTQIGNNVVVHWDDVAGAKSYMVSISGIADSDLPITSTSYNVGSLVDGVEVKIEAFSDSQLSNLIAVSKVNYEEPSSTTTVKNITYNEIGSNVVVSWDPVEGAKSYMVSIAGIPDSDLPITGTSYNVGSLVDGIEIKVEAFSDSQATQLIATGVIQYGNQQVGTIENLKLTADNGEVFVSWDYFTGASYYMILIDGQMILSNPTTSNQILLGSINPLSEVQVDAYADYNMQTLLAVGVTVYEGPSEIQPDPVFNLTESENGNGFTRLTWNNPLGAYTNIEIYDGERIDGYVGNRVKQLDGTTETSYIDNLSNGQIYTFYVYVVNENNTIEYMRYSEGAAISVIPTAAELNLNGTVWYNPGSNMFPVTMTLTFHANTVDWEEGDYNHPGLSYSFDGYNLTGIIDENGYYEGEFVVNEDASSLTLMGDFEFMRIQ